MHLSAPKSLTLTNDLAEIPRLAEAISAFIEPLDPSIEDELSVQLALEETVTNIIVHGYRNQAVGTCFLTVEFTTAQPHGVRATISDEAPAYDPLSRAEVDVNMPLADRPIGGLGVHLVRKLMHRATYQRIRERNVLCLERLWPVSVRRS